MLNLPAVLTWREAPQALADLSRQLASQAPGDVTVDASALAHFDTSAIALCLECRRLAQAAEHGLLLVNAPDKLLALARLYGVSGLLTNASPVATVSAP